MKVPEGYVAFVEELPGANTQGETLEEARVNLREAVTMVLDVNRELSSTRWKAPISSGTSTQDSNLVLLNLVNKPMLLIDSPRPAAFQLKP